MTDRVKEKLLSIIIGSLDSLAGDAECWGKDEEAEFFDTLKSNFVVYGLDVPESCWLEALEQLDRSEEL